MSSDQPTGQPEIHPTALVSPGAELGAGCSVGPFCVIGSGVRMGAGNVLASSVTISGPTTIGKGNAFYPQAVIGLAPQRGEHEDTGPLEIGNGNVFREGVTIQGSRAGRGRTVLGNECRLLCNAHVGHDCVIGDRVIVGNSAAIAGHVVIGEDAQLSGLVGVHQHVRIGRLAFVSANSFVDRSVPPFAIAAGHRAVVRAHNVVGLRRAGWTAIQLATARRLVRAHIFKSPVPTSWETDDSSVELVREWRDFVASSLRPVARGRF